MVSGVPYKGLKRKLLLAFDIGTTYSGISYSLLDPGRVPEIKGVTRFPAHEHISGASKIPTLIYYDQNGTVCAVGAEAVQEGILESAEEENWVKAELFKLHLRSKVGAGKNVPTDIPPLPLNKSVNDVFADFLKYLYECAASYIQDTHPNGLDLWKLIKDDIEYVLTHPNGWEGTQQSEMRKAIVLSKLIPDNVVGHARISFVTEGEASLHFCIENGLPSGVMNKGEGVVIVDAGGGTIDVSSYCRDMATINQHFEEIAPPECHFQGSVFVTVYARIFLEKYLADSVFAEDVDHIVRCFDKTTKPRFRSDEKDQYIKFGSTKDNDPEHNIRFGQVKIGGPDVASFFDPAIDSIVKVVLHQRKVSKKPISHVVLVGGFAASDWLFAKVHEMLTPAGLVVLRPENYVNKAVSDGAISFYLNNFVRTRVAKLTYGIFCAYDYDPTQEDHKKREKKAFVSPSGSKSLHGGFSVILPRYTQVSDTKEFKKTYVAESTSKTLANMAMAVTCYRGDIENPKWKDVDPENYTQLCNIEVDLSKLKWHKKRASRTDKYYTFQYSIILFFGLTELKAQVSWEEKGVEKRSPTRIIYDPET